MKITMENFQYKFVVSHNNELKNKLQICADCQNTVVAEMLKMCL